MKEANIIANYLAKLSKNNSPAMNLNDDVFFDKKNKLVVSIDTYNEGIHFFNFHNPELVVKKIIRSSISDLICKAVKPKYYFISAALTKNSLNKNNLNKIIMSLNSEQRKFKIKISGGDTTLSKNISFSITTIGFSNNIIERNKVKHLDDIYVTGNIGDSFIGLNILRKKIKKKNKLQKKFFISKYYEPKIPFKAINIINKFANSSIDVSDGLIEDLSKLLNFQKMYFKVYINKIPTSSHFENILKINNLDRLNFLFNGDDYQTIFTAQKKYRNIIFRSLRKMNQKVSIIGEISSNLGRNHLIYEDRILNSSDFRGYSHLF